MAEWFAFDGVAERGPFSEDEFFSFLKDKDPARIQIWREGLDAWVPAKSIPTLVAMMKPASRQSATTPAPAELAVTAGDHFAQFDDGDDVPAQESKWLWAIYGAGFGLAWGVLSVAIGGNIASLKLWSAEIVTSLLVPVVLKTLGLAIVGFAAGCVRDALRNEPVDEIVAATGGSAPANENQRPSDDAAKAA
jgi:uncharacterized protein DUF4339